MQHNEKIYAPIPPCYVGVPGQVLYSDKGGAYEGRWIYSEFWGWSHFIPKHPELFRELELGKNYELTGTIAKGRP